MPARHPELAQVPAQNLREIMNTEIFEAVLAALVAYRFLSPLIDAINPLRIFSGPKVASAPVVQSGGGKREQQG